MSDAITDWIKNRREMLTSPNYGEGDATLTATTALDALEALAKAIDEHDRAWTPYFDDDGAHAAGYRYATESILTGMRGVIAESLEAGL